MARRRPEVPLNITHIHGSDHGGGAELTAYDLHRQLQALGHSSLLLVGRKSRPDLDVVEIPHRRGPRGLVRTTRWLERVFGFQYLYAPGFRAVGEIIPPHTDVLHFHSLHGGGGYADIGALPGLTRRWASVVTLQDMWMLTGHCAHSGACERWKAGCGRCPDLTLYPAVSRDQTRFNFWRKRRALHASRLAVVTPSAWLAAKVRDSPLFSGRSVHVVPNAVDTNVFQPVDDKRVVRERLGLPTDKVVVLLVANLLELAWKGMAHALDALNRVTDPRVLVVLVGNVTPAFTRALERPWVAVPYQADRRSLASLYAGADLLVMPSLEEVFGMVAAEAMACGTPVVAYATGGLPEVVGDDGGLLAPRADVGGLAAGIAALVADDQKRSDLGRSAAARAALRFSLRQQARLYQAVYEEVVDGRR